MQVRLHFREHTQRAEEDLGRRVLERDTCCCLWRSPEAEWDVSKPSQDLGYQRALVVAVISCCKKKVMNGQMG